MAEGLTETFRDGQFSRHIMGRKPLKPTGPIRPAAERQARRRKGGCQHQADADLQTLIDAGRGDVPLTQLRFRCSNCGSDRTDFVVTSRDNPQPW